MTKSEYMKILQEKMQRYNIAVEQEILEDYEQHFAEGLAQGHTEEEIIAELGNIEDMLQEFSQEDLKQELEIVESQSSQSNSYERLYREVVIDGLLADMEVCRSGDDQLRIDYENRGSKAQKLRYYFYQYEENGIFYAGVKERKGVEFRREPGRDSFWDTFSHFSGQFGGNIDLRLEIPAGIPMIRLHTTSGDLEIREIQTDELEAQCTSGDLHVEAVECKKLSGRTQSGDVEISGVALAVKEDTEMDFHTTSGDIEIRRISAARIRIQTASGDLNAEHMEAEELKLQTASGEMELKNIQCIRAALRSGSGDMDIENIRGRELCAETGSGEVELRANMESLEINTGSGDIDLEAGPDARRIRLGAGSGDICLDMRQVPGASIVTRTGSGDMTVSGREASGRSYSTSYGSGTCQVEIVTGSGDIDVK